MGLFESTEKKVEHKKKNEFMQKYRLTEIDAEDMAMIEEIAADLAGLGLMKAGMALSLANSAEQATVGYLSAVVKQNWIIIRKLSEISSRLARAGSQNRGWRIKEVAQSDMNGHRPLCEPLADGHSYPASVRCGGVMSTARSPAVAPKARNDRTSRSKDTD